MGVVLVGETNDTLTLAFCRAKVVRGLAIFVEMTWHLAVTAGVMVVTASEASCFSTRGGRCISSKAEGLYLFKLMLLLAKLWVLPYKGPEAA
jgi:hypothetical protein